MRFKEIQQSKEKLTSHVTLEEFQEAFCEICTRPDVYFLLVQLSKDRECLDPHDLRLFLETEQGLSLSTADGCLELLKCWEPSAQGREKGLLGLDGFTRYLQSPECQLFDPEHLKVCQDMNMPLTHYYIRCVSWKGMVHSTRHVHCSRLSLPPWMQQSTLSIQHRNLLYIYSLSIYRHYIDSYMAYVC